MRLRLACALAFSALGAVLCAAPAIAQPTATPVDPSVLNSLDSLQRVIQRRILSDSDKKEIRACDREKTKFLKECRSDSAYARVDRELNDAKLHGADMNDPSVQALMEKKFAAEKACDDRYATQPRAKQCLTGEEKRRKALEKALKADKQYQSLLKKSAPNPAPLGAEHL
ncbi:MAG: hypothetical protein JF616_04130 [Fibrobacteres bacterium]|jgi:hypothetical protein|nr:hypothetical protein [Fibrobacterota bacterium]